MCVCVCYLLLYNKQSGFKQPLFYLRITLCTHRGSAGQFFYCSHFKSSCVCCQMVTGDGVSKVAQLTCQESGQWLGAVTSLSTWLAWDSLPVRRTLSANVPKPKPRCKHWPSFCLHAPHVNVPSGKSKPPQKRTIEVCAQGEMAYLESPIYCKRSSLDIVYLNNKWWPLMKKVCSSGTHIYISIYVLRTLSTFTNILLMLIKFSWFILGHVKGEVTFI